MKRKIVIAKIEGRIWSACFENGIISELNCENEHSILYNIYIGKVRKLVPSINAAFVEIANGLECYYSMEANEMPFFTKKAGKKPLCTGDELLVQVIKEASKTKQPAVSGKLSFHGKYAILTARDAGTGVSSKIGHEEKKRLLRIAEPYASDEYGLIIRTNANGTDESKLERELKSLIEEYRLLLAISGTRTCFSCLKTMPKDYLTCLRNVYQDGDSKLEILVEDPDIYLEAKAYLEEYQPEDLGKLRLYEDKLLPLHKLYSLEEHIRRALNERIWLKSGGYIVIQPTEALTVVDVNTGKCIDKKKGENTALNINIEAAKECARQLRLRNLSGIIIIDFINMDTSGDMKKLLDIFGEELKKDPVKTSLADITKLQLVEVTRKKVRRPLYEAVSG